MFLQHYSKQENNNFLDEKLGIFKVAKLQSTTN